MRVGIVVRIISLLADEVHDFVLAFSGAVGVREDHLDVLPSGVIVKTVVNVVTQTFGQLVHEGRAGSDAVRVEVLLLGVFFGQRSAASDDFLLDARDVAATLLPFFGRAETTTSLLVHLGARSLGNGSEGRVKGRKEASR